MEDYVCMLCEGEGPQKCFIQSLADCLWRVSRWYAGSGEKHGEVRLNIHECFLTTEFVVVQK